MRVFAVIGPSGAGKDTLMAAALARDPGLRLVRRIITRPAAAGGEDFEGVTADEFAARKAAGEFALDWSAHGLQYAIPHIRGDGDRLMNLSRRVLPQAAAAFPGMQVLHVTARPEVLAQRLVARGREAAHDIAARITRDAAFDDAGLPVVEIDNSGALEPALDQFMTAIRKGRT